MVIGVFCNTAIENASADKELASIKQVYMKSHQVQVLRKIFKEIDIDNANEVSIEARIDEKRAVFTLFGTSSC